MRFEKGDDRAVEAAQSGGAITGAARKGETITALCLKHPGSNRVALREAYDAGYRSGTGAKYQAQRRAHRKA